MKQEILKKIVELAEGFAYDDSLKLFYLNGNTWIWFKEIQEWEHYPLLLRRAIEGWNRSNSSILYFIDLLSDHMEYANGSCPAALILLYKDYIKTKYLTPQEQAIEACLIELLEGK